MGDKFRSIICLKSRYGESNVEDYCYYDGRYNIWKEMPRASDINDYGIFENPRWFLDNMKGLEFIDNTKEEDESTQKSKFIL